jgi:hypothetical protein
MKNKLPFVTCSMLAASMLLSAVPVSAENMSVLMSEDARRNAHVVNKGIKWHTSLEEAQAQAKKEGKMIFWMHMLGTIDGAT